MNRRPKGYESFALTGLSYPANRISSEPANFITGNIWHAGCVFVRYDARQGAQRNPPMNKTRNPVSSRFAFSRTVLLGVPFAVAFAGQAAAETHPEPEARVLVAPDAESGTLTVAQPVRERVARRSDRRPTLQERRSRRRARREDRSGPARWFGRRLASELELTDEQRDQVRETMREIGDRRRDSRRQVADARRSFRRAAQDRERSVEEIQALGEALGRAQADQVLQRRSERERIASILTEEQREQLEQMRERRGQREPRERRARNQRRRG